MAKHTLNVVALQRALDEHRERVGLTWRQVAAETGVSASTFSRLADGKHPDADALCSMVMWLGLSLRQFIRTDAAGTP